MSLITLIDSHPKTLFTMDFDGEVSSDEFKHFLIANVVQHVVVSKGEHRANGPAQKGTRDIDHMVKVIMVNIVFLHGLGILSTWSYWCRVNLT